MERRDGKPKNKRPQTQEEKRASVKASEQKLKHELFELLGGVCVLCGIDDQRCLQIDHVNNDGGYWRKKEGSRTHLRKMRDHLRNGRNVYRVRLLCANCHSITTWHDDGVLS